LEILNFKMTACSSQFFEMIFLKLWNIYFRLDVNFSIKRYFSAFPKIHVWVFLIEFVNLVIFATM
jgi:hypothetical protein